MPAGDHLPIDPDLAPSDPAEPSFDHHPIAAAERHTRAEPAVLAAIALGGALGASARYGVGQLISAAASGFPWGAFGVNISGSFVLGLLLVLVLDRYPPSRFVRPFVATGFLGAYTTYSTFAVDTVLLVREGHAGVAVVYGVASLTAGCAAAWIGILAARALDRDVPHA